MHPEEARSGLAAGRTALQGPGPGPSHRGRPAAAVLEGQKAARRSGLARQRRRILNLARSLARRSRDRDPASRRALCLRQLRRQLHRQLQQEIGCGLLAREIESVSESAGCGPR